MEEGRQAGMGGGELRIGGERKMERRCAEKKRMEGRIEEREFSLYSLEEQRKNKEN